MAGLGPAIHAFVYQSKTWMPATSAGMTEDVLLTMRNSYFANFAFSA